MTFTTITTKIYNKIATIIFNRPAVHNCMSTLFIEELANAMQTFSLDETIRIIILQAEGKSFCAGADLNDMKRMANYSEAENLQDARRLQNLLHSIYSCPKPTMAIVQGPAYGGGCGLVSCCDITLASAKAVFCFSEVKLGLIPAVISPYVRNKLSISAMQRYFLTAEVIDAHTAKDLGLIHQIVADDDLLIEAMRFAEHLLKNSPAAMKATKELIHTVNTTSDTKALQAYTAQAIATARVSPEGQEGLQAFLDKRKPYWT